jgi:hypothetical protein
MPYQDRHMPNAATPATYTYGQSKDGSETGPSRLDNLRLLTILGLACVAATGFAALMAAYLA